MNALEYLNKLEFSEDEKNAVWLHGGVEFLRQECIELYMEGRERNGTAAARAYHMKINNKVKKIANLDKDTTFSNWIYFTVSPDKIKQGSIGIDKLDVLKSWCDKWFQDYNYSEYFYAIESGKNKEEPHLHFHALVKGLNKSLKKRGHFSGLKKEWDLDVKLESVGSWAQKLHSKKSYDILWQPINSKELWGKKFDYLDNDLKGTHRNFVNLGGVPQGS